MITAYQEILEAAGARCSVISHGRRMAPTPVLMQDGDVIELDYQSMVVTPTTIVDDSGAPSL